MLRVAAVIAALLAVDAAAEPAGTPRGRSAARPDMSAYATATSAALSLFVNCSTGNNGNDCLTSSTPCLTIDGAYQKIPLLVRHPVDVTVTGSACTGGGLYGHSFAPASVTAGAWIHTHGAFANATLGAGSATGTVTSATAGTATESTFGTVVDSTQSWATDALAGLEVEITGGTGVGQSRVISSNTSTAVTVVGIWSPVPVAGSTYAIRTYDTTVSVAVNQSATPSNAAGSPVAFAVSGNSQLRNGAASPFLFSKMGTTTASAFAVVGPTSVSTLDMSLVCTGTCASARHGAQFKTSATNISSSGAVISTGSGTTTNASLLSLFQSRIVATGAAAAVGMSSPAVVFNQVEVLSTSSTTTALLDATQTGSGVQGVSAVTTRLTCAQGGSTRGLLITAETSFGSGYSMVGFGGSAPVITNCPVGIEVIGPSTVTTGSTFLRTDAGTGTAINVLRGGRVHTPGAQISGYPTELSVDAITTTKTALDALSPAVLMTQHGSFVGGTGNANIYALGPKWVMPGNATTCTLNGGTPSTCTATISPDAVCICTPVGNSAVIAAGGCAVSPPDGGVVMTATSFSTATNVVNILCDR